MTLVYSGAAIPPLGKPEIEYLAEEHTKSFSSFDGKEDPGFSAWKFAAHYLRKQVNFAWLSNNGSILGISAFVNGTSIPLFDPDANTVRWTELGADTILLSQEFRNPLMSLGKPRFTLMHECAHHLLHAGYFRHQSASGAGRRIAYSIQRDADTIIQQTREPWTDEEKMEWQANYLAAALLMPESRVWHVLEDSGCKEGYFQQVLARTSEPKAYERMVFRLANTISQAGFDPYERSIRGVTAMQKLIGKPRFDELLAAYIDKPQPLRISMI